MIRSYLDDYDHRMIEKYFDRIDELYTNVIKLIPQQYQNQTQYLIDQAVNYTDYAEFQEFLKIRQPTIFSLVYTQDCDIPITQS